MKCFMNLINEYFFIWKYCANFSMCSVGGYATVNPMYKSSTSIMDYLLKLASESVMHDDEIVDSFKQTSNLQINDKNTTVPTTNDQELNDEVHDFKKNKKRRNIWIRFVCFLKPWTWRQKTKNRSNIEGGDQMQTDEKIIKQPIENRIDSELINSSSDNVRDIVSSCAPQNVMSSNSYCRVHGIDLTFKNVNGTSTLPQMRDMLSPIGEKTFLPNKIRNNYIDIKSQDDNNGRNINNTNRNNNDNVININNNDNNNNKTLCKFCGVNAICDTYGRYLETEHHCIDKNNNNNDFWGNAPRSQFVVPYNNSNNSNDHGKFNFSETIQEVTEYGSNNHPEYPKITYYSKSTLENPNSILSPLDDDNVTEHCNIIYLKLQGCNKSVVQVIIKPSKSPDINAKPKKPALKKQNDLTKKLNSTVCFSEIVEYIEVGNYDRKIEKTWNRLKSDDKEIIRRELNCFKLYEMPVHENSRHMIRFHKLANGQL